MASDASWLTSVPDAKTKAEKEKKLVLLDFTGLDWCGWCKKLDAEVFSKPEFASLRQNESGPGGGGFSGEQATVGRVEGREQGIGERSTR